MSGELFYCPVEGCEWWAALGGHTVKNIGAMKRHVQHDHHELPGHLRRLDGGLVDSVIARALIIDGIAR